MRARLFLCVVVASASLNALAADELYGTWKLVSFHQVLPTGEKAEVFGKAPKGFISYSRDGRMYAILAKDERPKPSDMAKASNEERVELFNSMAAYAGTFTFDGKTVVHYVDISWNESWTGTKQVRHASFKDGKLTLRTDPIPSGVDGRTLMLVLEWEKVATK
jgi:hypothetical protein